MVVQPGRADQARPTAVALLEIGSRPIRECRIGVTLKSMLSSIPVTSRDQSNIDKNPTFI